MGIFGRKIEKEFDIREAGASVLPPARSNTPAVTAETAMSLAAVYRCVSIISSTLSQLPMSVRRGNEALNVALANRPDINLSPSEFWSQTVVSLALTGNAYWYVARNSNGQAQNLTVLNPNAMTVSVEELSQAPFQRVRYDYGGRVIPNNNIKHLRLLTMPGSHIGIGPIQSCRLDVQSALALRTYGDSVLSNGGIPTGVLSSDQFLTQDQADAYRDKWNEAQAQRGLAVLGSGLDYSPISLSPADIQFLENQMFSNNQIARLFGVPAIWLGLGIDGSSLTYATTETLGQMFLTTTGSQYTTVIEQAMTDLLPRGQVAKFKVDALLRADIVSRTNAYKNLVEIGAMTPEQVAASEGLDGRPAQDGSPV